MVVGKMKNENSYKNIFQSSSMKKLGNEECEGAVRPLSSNITTSAKILNIQTKDDSKSYKILEHHEEATEEPPKSK